MINFRSISIFILALCLIGMGLSACNLGRSKSFSRPLYVRGSFNNWGLSAPMSALPEGYVAQVQLPAGKNEIKIADKSWEETDLGISPSQEIELDKPIALVENAGHGNNIIVNVYEDLSNHVFLLSVADDGKIELKVMKGKLKESPQ